MLVGGVLQGKELIEAAERNAVISDVRKYQVAVNTFSLQFDGLPGDFDEAEDYWPSCVVDPSNAIFTCNGDGDGIISNSSSASFASTEPIRAWQHLSLSEIVAGSYDGMALSGFFKSHIPNSNCPPTPEGDGGCYGLGYLHANPTTLPFIYRKNYIAYMRPNPSSGYKPFEGIISPQAAKSIDTKLDDGVANTGGVLSAPNQAEDSNCTINPGTDDNYNLTTDDGLCRMYFKMMQ